jgi:hypothetical protein
MNFISDDPDDLREKIAEQSDEIVILTRLLAQKKDEITDSFSMDWLKQVLPLLHNPVSAIKALIPARMQAQQVMATLKARKLFDGNAYLSANPDVAAARADPLQHYLAHGIWEGRSLGIDWEQRSSAN